MNPQVGELFQFSVRPLCSLCLCGEHCRELIHHRDTEDTEVAQRELLHSYSPRDHHTRVQETGRGVEVSNRDQVAMLIAHSNPLALAPGSFRNLHIQTIQNPADLIVT